MTDLPVLREHFLDLAARQSDKPGPRKTFSDEALKLLAEHDWPGNVRELKGVIETAYVFADTSPTIEAWHLKFPPLTEEPAEDDAPARRISDLSPRSEHAPKKHRTDEELIAAYRHCQGNIAQAAKLADVDRSTMQRRLRRLGFRPPKS